MRGASRPWPGDYKCRVRRARQARHSTKKMHVQVTLLDDPWADERRSSHRLCAGDESCLASLRLRSRMPAMMHAAPAIWTGASRYPNRGPEMISTVATSMGEAAKAGPMGAGSSSVIHVTN